MDYLSKPGITKAVKEQFDITLSTMSTHRYIERYSEYFTDTQIKNRVVLFPPGAVEIIKDIYTWYNSKGYDQDTIRQKLAEKYGGADEVPTKPHHTVSNIDIMNKLIDIERILKVLFYETEMPDIPKTPTITQPSPEPEPDTLMNTEPGPDASESQSSRRREDTEPEPLVDTEPDAVPDIEQYISDNDDIPQCKDIELTPEQRNTCIEQVMTMFKKTADRMDYLNEKCVTKANGQPWGKGTQLTNYIYNNLRGRKKE